MFECSILFFEFYISVVTCIKSYLFKKCCLTVILNRYERANLLHEEFQFGDMHAKIVDDFHSMLRPFLEFSSNDSELDDQNERLLLKEHLDSQNDKKNTTKTTLN